MKKFTLLIFTLLFFSIILPACNKDIGDNVNANNTKIELTATITKIDNVMYVNVIEGEYAFGDYVLILTNNTKYFNVNGEKLSKTDFKVGDKIKVNYSGQTMLSLPPQVVAYIVTKL